MRKSVKRYLDKFTPVEPLDCHTTKIEKDGKVILIQNDDLNGYKGHTNISPITLEELKEVFRKL